MNKFIFLLIIMIFIFPVACGRVHNSTNTITIPKTLVYTPLYYPPFVKAAETGDIPQAENLLSEGEFINQTTYFNQTPLHLAALAGQTDMVRWLLAREANPYVKDQSGKTPADDAHDLGHIDTEKVILDFIQLLEREQQAYAAGNRDLLKQLLEEDGRQYTLLHIFAQTGYLPGVEDELALGANINAKTALGLTPLHKSVISGNEEIARRLLAAGANVNATDYHNETPLFGAVSQNKIDLVQLFLEAGGDPNIRAVPGNINSLEYAEQFKFTEIADLLRKNMKSP